MTVTAFKANSEDTILPKFNDKTVDEAITILPSTLMKTPSLSFAIGYSAVFGVQRIIKISYTFTTTEVKITEFETLLKSNVGLHVVTFREVLTIPVGDFLDDETNSLYIAVEYIQNDPQNMDYPLDNVSITSQKSTDTPPANAIKIMDVEVSGGDIVSVVDNYNPSLETATKGWVDDNYLSQADAEDTYLSKTDAEDIYLTQTDAGNTYLTQTDAEDTYLTQIDAKDTYLTQTDADNIQMYGLTSTNNYHVIEWQDYKGVTNQINHLHQELIDVSTNSLTADESTNTEILFNSKRIGNVATDGDIDTRLIDIKGSFVGSRNHSWWDLGMYINLYDFEINGVRSSESTDRWSFVITLPLEDILRDRLNNNNIVLNDTDNDNATYQGSVNVQTTGYIRDDSTTVFIPDFVGICWIDDGDLKMSVQGDVMTDLTTISSITSLGLKVKISGIGKI